MKKILFVITLLLAVTLAAGVLAETAVMPVQREEEEGLPFTREQAISKMNDVYAEHYGVREIQGCRMKAGSVVLEDGRTAWIEFLEKWDDAAPGSLYLVLSAEDGEVIEEYWPEDDDVYTWILLQWGEAKGGAVSKLPVEEQALFQWLFGPDDGYFDTSKAAVQPLEGIGIADEWLKENFGLVYNDASLSFSGRYDDNGNMLYYWTVTFYSDGEEAYLVHVDTETGEVINSFDLSEGNG